MEYIHRWIQLEVVRGHSISAGYQASLDRSIGNLGAGGLLHNIYARLEALTVTDPAPEKQVDCVVFSVSLAPRNSIASAGAAEYVPPVPTKP